MAVFVCFKILRLDMKAKMFKEHWPKEESCLDFGKSSRWMYNLSLPNYTY